MRPGKVLENLFLEMGTNIPVLVLTMYSQEMSHVHLTTFIVSRQEKCIV